MRRANSLSPNAYYFNFDLKQLNSSRGLPEPCSATEAANVKILTQSRQPKAVDRTINVIRFLRSHSINEAAEERLNVWACLEELLIGGPFSQARLSAMTGDNEIVKLTFSAWNKFSHDDIRNLLAHGMKDMDIREKEMLSSIINLYFLIRGAQ
ncbi:hypothetical protein CCR75_007581 [Bremia lactucae]|uniref:Uncharacterized protein n=1 Tax=Bremia lactucae TaxID=4779 RepID=A0A976FJR1_BRELC|nr:hypothetical protein CCR75_007581 [Bremia lactucae]